MVVDDKLKDMGEASQKPEQFWKASARSRAEGEEYRVGQENKGEEVNIEDIKSPKEFFRYLHDTAGELTFTEQTNEAVKKNAALFTLVAEIGGRDVLYETALGMVIHLTQDLPHDQFVALVGAGVKTSTAGRLAERAKGVDNEQASL
jgi:hypothetical protein